MESRRTLMDGLTLLHVCCYVFSVFRITIATDTITANQSIRDGETIISVGGSFELGFFSPGESKNRYLGIWYKKISSGTVVWVANREIPLMDSSGALNFTDQGALVLLNGTNSIIWSSNSSTSAQNPYAQLLESGNLVVKTENDSNQEIYLWQSFDYPCHTFLPGMKLGKNTLTHPPLDQFLSSWTSPDDPSPGNFTYRLDPSGFPQLILRKGSVVQFRSGPWNGLRFSGFPQLRPNPVYKFWFVFNDQEMYYTYELQNSSVVSRLVLNPNGLVQRFTWIDRTHGWILYSSAQTDNCDTYAFCGSYGGCNINRSPPCECLKGFVPKFPKDWDMADWSNGCIRTTSLNCPKLDGFLKYSGVKLPDTRLSWFNESMNLRECETVCLKNCSCTAYANLDIRGGGSGCLLWFGDLIDIREFSENGQDLYVRMAASEADQYDNVNINGSSQTKKHTWLIVSLVMFTGLLLLGLALMVLYLRKKRKQMTAGEMGNQSDRGYADGSGKEDVELPLFDLPTLADATSNFSVNNKLGEGGFGPVYKGMLKDGKEIAVKRLSQNSRQGLDEFKNEVIYIVKLQHRNLVKLLGCCIQEEERMLIYEYMPNKSLDHFIFDETQSTLLDWDKRFHIINGIARGLLYLHQDSRLRIIHRDLKADNILLDTEMNPKISDFGMARCFGGNETEANTNKVVGTYGYMSPEYAGEGLYSIKSDVYSFGVLLLEIVSGKRNRRFSCPKHHLNLLGHAWTLFMEGGSLELIDAAAGNWHSASEVLRSVHVGLLCVQQCPEDRPSMSSVVLMLGGEGALPRPKEPGFFTKRNLLEANSSSSKHKPTSTNRLTMTLLEAR